MALNDAFTLDLFGNTSLSSGLGLGVTAFPAAGEPDDADRAVSSTTPAPALPLAAAASKPAIVRGENFHIDGDRGLAKRWRDRARENIAAIRLAAAVEAERRPPTAEEQAETHPLHGLRRVRARQRRLQAPGRGRVPERLGGDRRRARARCRREVVRVARALHTVRHFTPEYIVRAVRTAVMRLGFRGGRVLEPGIGSGLFPALMPAALRDVCHVTGVELDPVTTRIVKLLQPHARILNEDFLIDKDGKLAFERESVQL